MHTICKAHHKKCFDTNSDLNLAILIIRSTLIGAGLLNRLIRDVKNYPIKYDHDEDHLNTQNHVKTKHKQQ